MLAQRSTILLLPPPPQVGEKNQLREENSKEREGKKGEKEFNYGEENSTKTLRGWERNQTLVRIYSHVLA